MAEGVMNGSAFAVAQCENQRLGLLAPVGIGLDQYVNITGAMQLGV